MAISQNIDLLLKIQFYIHSEYSSSCLLCERLKQAPYFSLYFAYPTVSTFKYQGRALVQVYCDTVIILTDPTSP